MNEVPASGATIVFGDGPDRPIGRVVAGYPDGTWCVTDDRGLGWIVEPLAGVAGRWRAIRRRVTRTGPA